MEDIVFYQTMGFSLLVFLLTGYAILDGFDLGVGMLLPLLGKRESERNELLASLAPVWDGNEVWLIAAGAALFATFPHAYATIFSGFYLAFLTLLAALILRAASLEFYGHDQARAHLWGAVFFGGSTAASFIFALAVGNVIYGVPLDGRLEYAGDFTTLFRPFPLAFAFVWMISFSLQGMAWLTGKTSGTLEERVFRFGRAILWVNIFAAIAYLLMLTFLFPRVVTGYLFYMALILIASGLVGMFTQLRRKRKKGGFLCASLFIMGLGLSTAVAQFPYLVRPAGGELSGLTIYNASSSLGSLEVTTVLTLLGLPIVIGYTVYAYRVFRGKASSSDHY